MVSCVRNISREAVAAPSRPWMATSRRHPLFLLFGPPTRPTTQTPHNTQQSRGVHYRGAPGQNCWNADGQTLGTGTLRMGFAQLTTSRSRLARTRHHRRQSSVTSEFGDITEFRCPGPTPSDAASPVCPSRHHAAGYGQLPPGLQRVQHDFHPITMMCTSHHHIITYYIARTDRADGCSVTRHWKTSFAVPRGRKTCFLRPGEGAPVGEGKRITLSS